MAIVVPTVLASSPDEYEAMMQRAHRLSTRVHVDVCDGRFADTTTVGLAQIHVPEGTTLDLHLMVQDPAAQLETALSLHPHLIIFHAESDGDVAACMQHAKELGVKVGVALLQQTPPAAAKQLLELADHALIFTGTLGHNDGKFGPDQLVKGTQIRAIKSDIEISVDGGVSDKNAALVVLHGVNVLYVGGFLQQAPDPQGAYDSITRQAAVTV